MPAGRPTKYRPELCSLLIKHMAEGLSFESFAATAETNRDTLYAWAIEHEAFSDAKSKGTALYNQLWEKINLAHATGKIKTGSSNVIFTMKARLGWRDDAIEANDLDLKLNYKID